MQLKYLDDFRDYHFFCCRAVVCMEGAGLGVWLAQAGTALVHLFHIKTR